MNKYKVIDVKRKKPINPKMPCDYYLVINGEPYAAITKMIGPDDYKWGFYFACNPCNFYGCFSTIKECKEILIRRLNG